MARWQSGIYRILCAPSGKAYIGSSKNIVARWAAHRSKLRLNKHGNPHLQYAWNMYGAEAFIFEIVEELEPDNLLDR